MKNKQNVLLLAAAVIGFSLASILFQTTEYFWGSADNQKSLPILIRLAGPIALAFAMSVFIYAHLKEVKSKV